MLLVHRVVVAGDQRREVCRDRIRGRELPEPSVFLDPGSIRRHGPVGGRRDLECDGALDVGLVETREHPMRVVALEVAVQVGTTVQRILEAVQAGAVTHVLRDRRHLEDVVLLEVVDDDAAAVESA